MLFNGTSRPQEFPHLYLRIYPCCIQWGYPYRDLISQNPIGTGERADKTDLCCIRRDYISFVPKADQTACNNVSSMMTPTEKPHILLVSSSVREIDSIQWARVTASFNVLNYDCESVEQFCERLSPGGPYSKIRAIVRTGWLDAEPYSTHKIFQKQVLKHYPPSMEIIVCSGHGYDDVHVDTLTAMGIWYCNSPNTGVFMLLYFSWGSTNTSISTTKGPRLYQTQRYT